MSVDLVTDRLPGRLSATGFVLRDGVTFEEWAQAGEFLGRLGNAASWAIGDWVFHGQWEFGSKYEQALAQTGLDYGTLRNLASVCGRIDMSRRRDKLSFGHHASVASLPVVEQDDWLERAEGYGWPVMELRDRIRRSRELGGGADETVTLEQLRLERPPEQVARWKAAAEQAGLDLVVWAEGVLDAAAC